MTTEQDTSKATIAARIDHTLLASDAGAPAIIELCSQAVKYGFATVCVHPCHVRQAADLLDGHSSKVCTVLGFPLGANHRRVKQAEADQATSDGAEELDMVINQAAVRAGDLTYLAGEIEAVLTVCRQNQPATVLKLILETPRWDTQTKITLCRLASDLRVDFIKTSTGFHRAGGATIEDVKLLHAHRGNCQVKAAGGIGTLTDLNAMLQAGADRIGTSSAIAIMTEQAG